ncbi:MAG TPA: hypothetical protein VGG35_15235 [Streptosporangiaceae bacterium]
MDRPRVAPALGGQLLGAWPAAAFLAPAAAAVAAGTALLRLEGQLPRARLTPRPATGAASGPPPGRR